MARPQSFMKENQGKDSNWQSSPLGMCDVSETRDLEAQDIDLILLMLAEKDFHSQYFLPLQSHKTEPEYIEGNSLIRKMILKMMLDMLKQAALGSSSLV